jgi:ATP-dependent Clp protease protease subunit
MAIYDVMQLVRADVSTIGLGIAGSTASIILGGGTKGKRFAMPNTRIMIHQPVGGARGMSFGSYQASRAALSSRLRKTLTETGTWVLLRLLIMESSMV